MLETIMHFSKKKLVESCGEILMGKAQGLVQDGSSVNYRLLEDEVLFKRSELALVTVVQVDLLRF